MFYSQIVTILLYVAKTIKIISHLVLDYEIESMHYAQIIMSKETVLIMSYSMECSEQTE